MRWSQRCDISSIVLYFFDFTTTVWQLLRNLIFYQCGRFDFWSPFPTSRHGLNNNDITFQLWDMVIHDCDTVFCPWIGSVTSSCTSDTPAVEVGRKLLAYFLIKIKLTSKGSHKEPYYSLIPLFPYCYWFKCLWSAFTVHSFQWHVMQMWCHLQATTSYILEYTTNGKNKLDILYTFWHKIQEDIPLGSTEFVKKK